MSSTTITILDSRLLLVRIPLSKLNESMHSVVDAWWHRPKDDPFFALASNGVECSLFADARSVSSAFRAHMDSSDNDKGKQKIDESAIIVGPDEWVALEFSFHGGEGWREAGQRVRDFSSPLADEGVSILFLSTYISDYILVRVDKLKQVTSILEHSGFTFTAASDDEDAGHHYDHHVDEDEIVPPSGPSKTPLKRSSTYGSRRSSDRGASLAGSLVLADSDRQGSITSPQRRYPSSSVSLSRTGSLSSSAARRSRHGSAGSASRSPAPQPFTPHTIPSRLQTDDLDGSEQLGQHLPQILQDSALFTSPSSPVSTFSPLSRLAMPFAPGDSLTILPDELVCVGLAKDREALWRSKIVEALFYPSRILPPSSSAFDMAPLESGLATARPGSSAAVHSPTEHGGRGAPLSASLSSQSFATVDADDPVPFVAFTQTDEGASLTADVRLLRQLFDESEEDMVYVVGAGGLRAPWDGEDETYANEELDGDESESSRSGDDDWSEDADGRGRRRTRMIDTLNTSASNDALRKHARRKSEDLVAPRQILKCIQLDLTRYGLDKPGIVEHLAGLLLSNGIDSLMYQSTFASANVLVSKGQIAKARRILVRASQAGAAAASTH